MLERVKLTCRMCRTVLHQFILNAKRTACVSNSFSVRDWIVTALRYLLDKVSGMRTCTGNGQVPGAAGTKDRHVGGGGGTVRRQSSAEGDVDGGRSAPEGRSSCPSGDHLQPDDAGD